MKRTSYQFTLAAARAIASGVLVATIAFASVSVLAAQASGANHVEARIQDMHTKLKITAEQDAQWQQVAQVMRDNEKRMEPLIKDREKNAKTMTAVDDLKSYAQIIEAQEEGTKNFIPVFVALYDSMSDDQKKEADVLFRHRAHKMSKTK
jgi:Spy/CpxP family protein refolding chaperone